MTRDVIRAALLALPLVACGDAEPPLPIADDGRPMEGPFFTPLAPGPGTQANLFDVQGDGEGRLWAVGERGYLALLEDGAWRSFPLATAADLRSVWVRGSDDVFVVGTGGTILHLEDGVWVEETSPVQADLNAVEGGGGRVIAVGHAGTILERDGEGVWSVVDGGTIETINDVHVDGSGRALAVGNLGLLLRADAEGNWHRQRVDGLDEPLQAVWGTDVDHFYAVGLDGTVLRGGPDGALDPLPGAPQIFLRDVWGSSMHDAWIVGWGGAVLHVDGSEVEQVRGVTDHRLEAVWGAWLPGPKEGETEQRFYLVGVGGTVLVGP